MTPKVRCRESQPNFKHLLVTVIHRKPSGSILTISKLKRTTVSGVFEKQQWIHIHSSYQFAFSVLSSQFQRKVFSPFCRFLFGQVSIYASGLSDETPFTFANAIPGLKFHWSSSNPDVCQVKSVYALVNYPTTCIILLVLKLNPFYLLLVLPGQNTCAK